MFRKTKSRTNLRQRVRSDDDDDDVLPSGSVGEAGTTSGNGSVNNRGTKMDAEKVIYKEEIEERTVVVKPKPNSLLSFDDVEGLLPAAILLSQDKFCELRPEACFFKFGYEASVK